MRSAFLVSLAVTAFAAVPALAGTPMPMVPGDQVPELSGYRQTDGQYTEVDYGGKRYTIVNFFSSWCEPCKNEIPQLNDLFKRYGGDGLEVVGVWSEQTDPESERVDDFLGALGVDYPVLRSHRTRNHGWRTVTITPTTFLIDGDGKVVRRYVGALPEHVAGMVRDVDAVMSGEPLPTQVILEFDEATGKVIDRKAAAETDGNVTKKKKEKKGRRSKRSKDG